METGRATAGCLFARKCNVAVSTERMKLMDIAKNWRFQRGWPADGIREDSWENR